MIKYHDTLNDTLIAELLPGSDMITTPQEMLEIMAEMGYNGCSGMIILRDLLHPDFFDLKTGLAGEILQKFSNYRMRLAVVGDFSALSSKSLGDFIRESNKFGTISFVDTIENALDRLSIIK